MSVARERLSLPGTWQWVQRELRLRRGPTARLHFCRATAAGTSPSSLRRRGPYPSCCCKVWATCAADFPRLAGRQNGPLPGPPRPGRFPGFRRATERKFGESRGDVDGRWALTDAQPLASGRRSPHVRCRRCRAARCGRNRPARYPARRTPGIPCSPAAQGFDGSNNIQSRAFGTVETDQSLLRRLQLGTGRAERLPQSRPLGRRRSGHTRRLVRRLGANVIQTFAVSCNGYAWYQGGKIPAQPGLKHDFLTEVVKLGHQKQMRVMGYFCVAANTRWAKTHPDLSYGFPAISTFRSPTPTWITLARPWKTPCGGPI